MDECWSVLAVIVCFTDTTEIQSKIKDSQFLADLAFLTDTTQYLNDLN